VRLRFWGTRGSIASPGEATARYGGNTSCVEVRAGDGTVIVLDCGTGARALGVHLAREAAQQPMHLHLFIGHTHWDHIQGFPFFVPAFLPGAELNVYAPLGFQQSLEEAMAGQMEYSYFPVKLRDLRSRIHFTELEEGFFRVGSVLVETQYLNHTAPTIAYRMSSNGATLAYVTDHEQFAYTNGAFHHPGDQHHVGFLRGVDVLIHDAQYSEAEYATRLGWGHSSIEYATDVALAAGARRLILFHHDPTHDDATMDRLEAGAQARVAAASGVLDVFAAREGMEIEVEAGRSTPPMPAVSALRRRLIAGARVLIVSSDGAEVASIERVLAEDGILSVPVPDMRAAITRGTEYLPDLAIVDTSLPPGDGVDLVQAFRTRMGRMSFPVILLADRTDDSALHRGGAIATDYFVKPYSPPMLRARVRAWLARTLVSHSETAPVDDGLPALTLQDARDDRQDARALFGSMLAAVPLFRGCTPPQIATLVATAAEKIYPAGTVVTRQGQAPEHLWVLLSGRVRVVEATTDGQAEMLLGEIGRAEIFGELGILRDQPRSATVIAVDRTHCLVLRHTEFVHVLQESTALANGLLRVLAARIYDADRKLARYAPDPLTGLAGRRAFHEQYRRLASGARRRKTGLLLLALDVVNLKSINDGFGYALGDEVLRTVADALTEATRTTDVVARCGGDEFAVMLLDAMPEDVDIVVARVRDKLAALSIQRRLPVTAECSTGIAWSQSPPDTADEFLREADRDMHAHKKARKDTN
jgi:diguanylate cyclase (GGDEF)-like protein